MMLWDQHMHSSFSGDSTTPPRMQIERAIELKLPGICFTEHCDMDFSKESRHDFSLDFPTYYPAIRALAEEYKDRIKIHVGVEMGLQPHLRERIDEILSTYDFDYVIGSTHMANGKDLVRKAFYEGRTEKEALTEYFEAVLENVRAFDNFDTAAHLDYPVRYCPNKNKYYTYREYADLIDEILRILVDKDKALELNTGGFDCGLGHANPHEDIIKRFRELGGEKITVGADGHIPSEVGGHFDRAKSILQECGFAYYTVFEKRHPQFVKL